MAQDGKTEVPGRGEPSAGERLDSWKEIAAYLRRGVRTVQRWEKREELPVYRHLHDRHSTVYAYRAELDVWWNNRRPNLEKPRQGLGITLRGWLAAVLLLLAVGLGLVVWLGFPATVPWRSGTGHGSRIVDRRIWAGPGMGLGAAVSPEGRYISFSDLVTGDLAILEVSSGETRRLTHKGTWFDSVEFAFRSAVFLDGGRIAYAWHNEDLFFELRLTGLDGSEPWVLFRDEAIRYLEVADRSPDGKQILATFGRTDGSHQIVSVSVVDGSVGVLKTLDWRRPLTMRFSPDGRYIAYDLLPHGAGSGPDIFLLSTDGGREIPLVQNVGADFLLGWTPDDSCVLFLSDRTGSLAAWAVPTADGQPQADPHIVTQGRGRIWPIGFARTGDYYYLNQKSASEVYLAALDPAAGTVLNSPAPATQRFVGFNGSPEWSPDGRYLALVSQTSPGLEGPGSWGLSILSLGDDQQRVLYPRLNYAQRLRWSPDGSSILTTGKDHNDQGGLFQIDTATGAVTRILLSGPGQGSYPRQAAWAPDGKAVYYRHYNSPIYRRDLRTGRDTETYSGARDFALSPDGRWLVVDERKDEGVVLKIVPVDGGAPRELLRLEEPLTDIAFPVWSADGRHILFVVIREGKDSELWRVPAEGGEPQRLGIRRESLRHLRTHSDGRRIAFSSGSSDWEIWVMENLSCALPP